MAQEEEPPTATPAKRRGGGTNRRTARPDWRRTETIYTKNADLLPKKRPVGGLARRERKDAAVEAVVRSQQRPLTAKSPNANANAAPLRPTRPRSAPTRAVPLHRSPAPVPPDGFVAAAKPSRPASAARLRHLAKHKILQVDEVLPSINARPCSRERLLSLSRPKKVPPEAGPLESGQVATRPATAARLEALSRPIVRHTHEVVVHTPIERPKMRPVGKREEVQGATAMDSRVEGARVFSLDLSHLETNSDGQGKPSAPGGASVLQKPAQKPETAEPAVETAAEAKLAGEAQPVVEAAAEAASAVEPAAEAASAAEPAAEVANAAESTAETEPSPRREAEAEPKSESDLATEGAVSEPKPEVETSAAAAESAEVAPIPSEQSADSQEAAANGTEPPAESHAAPMDPPAAEVEPPSQQQESALEGSVENAWAGAAIAS